MITPENILLIFENGLPPYGYGVSIDFCPTNILFRQLTFRFKIEFAVVWQRSGYLLFVGNNNSVELPVGGGEILIKHTHPNGTPYPSIYDIQWLELAQLSGSPQRQSLILPHAQKGVTFNVDSFYLR